MNQKTFLKDGAQAVGVSITLLSYVLNNQKVNRINKEVAQKNQTGGSGAKLPA